MPDRPSVNRLKGLGCQSIAEWLLRKVLGGAVLFGMLPRSGDRNAFARFVGLKTRQPNGLHCAGLPQRIGLPAPKNDSDGSSQQSENRNGLSWGNKVCVSANQFDGAPTHTIPHKDTIKPGICSALNKRIRQ